MAVQGTIVTMGNLAAPDAYLRISDITTKKIIDNGNPNNGKWQMTYGVDCYVSADERAKDSRVTLVAPTVDRFKVITADEPSDPYAVAYTDLKTQNAVSNPSDLV